MAISLGASSVDVGASSEPARTDDRVSLVDPLPRWAEQAGGEIAFTFVDYGSGREGALHTFTWAELDRRVRAVAARLQQLAGRGDRVAILCPQGLDYVVGFLGSVRAGLVAVPLFGPELPGHVGRLEAVIANCDPAVVLTTSAREESTRRFRDGLRYRPDIVSVDGVPADFADSCVPVAVTADEVAYLQYTSGSTRSPAGVVITHDNAVTNARQAIDAYGLHRDRTRSVSWLPLFHDMGLMMSIVLPIVLGNRSVIMDPAAFLRHPDRWLQLMSKHPRAFSAAPNFAFDYCVRRTSGKDKGGLALDQVHTIINGSEPVRPETIERFAQEYAPCGFPPEAHRPSFGLAEATVFVAASPRRNPVARWFDRDALAGGTARLRGADDPRASHLAACGTAVGQHLAIIDPSNGRLRPDGHVGEIWLHGRNIGRGFWNQPEETARTFGAVINGARGNLPRGNWMRTGDLGLIHDGELYITGRIKDMIIVDGRNHYPQDIEATVEEVHPLIRPGCVAAFSVETRDSEGVVVVAGRAAADAGSEADQQNLVAAVRREVSARHGLALEDLVLVPPGAVPRTSSGKVARGACRKRYIEGQLATTEGAA